MKKINYSRVFTQKLRANKVFGIFCEYANETLIELLYSKRDLWTKKDGANKLDEMIIDTINKINKDGKFDEEKLIRRAFLTTDEIKELTDMN